MKLRTITIVSSVLIWTTMASGPASGTPLDSASVAQRNVRREEYEKIKSVTGITALWFFGHPITYYHVPMGSEHMYRSYAEVLFGRPALDEEELKRMSLRIRFWFALPDYKAITEGILVNSTGVKTLRTLKQNCRPDAFQLDYRLSGLTRSVCTPSGGSEGVRLDWIASSYDKIIWTNGQEGVVLITRYVNKSVVDWKVLSLDSRLSNKTQEIILEKVRSLDLQL